MNHVSDSFWFSGRDHDGLCAPAARISDCRNMMFDLILDSKVNVDARVSPTPTREDESLLACKKNLNYLVRGSIESCCRCVMYWPAVRHLDSG